MSRGGETFHRLRTRRRSSECAGGHARTPARDTHGARVTVHYRFHPLCGRELEVVSTPRSADGGAVTVADPTGRRLKIPCWMLSTEAGELGLTAQAEVGVRALLNLAELLKAHLSPPEPATTRDSLSPTSESAERRKTRGAASTGGRSRRTKRRSASHRARSQAKSDVGRADGAGARERARGTTRQEER